MKRDTLAISIADKKNSELQLLTGLVTQAQYEVAEQQAIVNSLTAKSQQYAQYLAQADGDKDAALANLNMGKDTLASASSVAASMDTANKKTASAAKGASDVSAQMAELINKLILSVEYINKVGQMVNNQKNNNKSVPDSLVGHMAKASTAANNAIALTLAALQSCYVAESTLLESNNVLALGAQQSSTLTNRMQFGWEIQSGQVMKAAVDALPGAGGLGLLAQLQDAYDNAKTRYELTLAANNIVAQQLSQAQAQLADATVDLDSYQSGLAAATAAAYAA